MTIAEVNASIEAATARLLEHRLRSMLQIEPAVLPKRSPRPPRRVQRTLYMRRNFGPSEVALLETLIARAGADPLVLLDQWRQRKTANQRHSGLTRRRVIHTVVLYAILALRVSKSSYAIARTLNAEGTRTRYGKTFTTTTVQNILRRAS